MWLYNYSPEYLEHHGILGMKWGKRNGPPYPLNPSDRSAAEKRANNGTSGSPSIGKKKNAIQKAAEILGGKKSKKTKIKSSEPKQGEKKRTIHDLSDAELRDRVQRLELEMKYSDLMRRMNPKKESRAKKVIYDILERSAKDLGTQALKYAAGSAINKASGKNIININNNDKKDKDK